MLGIHFQSWAQWLAEALELPFTNLAADGAMAGDVLRAQVPRLRGPYDLGGVYIGVNDARSVAWDAAAFERDARAIVTALGDACERVLVVTPPHDLGRPPAAPKPERAGAILRHVAGEANAVVCDLSDFGGRRHALPDAVHPTSLGELAIADAAALALGAGIVPSTLAEPLRGVGGVLLHARFEAWWARLWARDVMRRVRERGTVTGR